MRVLLTLLAALAAAVLAPPATAACSSDQPTFQEAIGGAVAIAVVRISEPELYDEMEPTQSFTVVTVIKGSLPETLTLPRPRTGLCGDTIGFWAKGMRRNTVLVAFGVPFYQTTINPVWGEPRRGYPSLFGTAGTPPGVTSLEELIAAVRDQIPDTSLPRGAADNRWLGVLLLTISIWLAAGRRGTLVVRPNRSAR
jgi:hypothetical protein